ncbi:MAG: O-antigen ligase family protein [Clostridia bacterium]|nr:O-antigen ligase family protein [Bacilli bacterium]MBR3511482.1 O-antigen ligase family protein [Clostridia bacterium]
MKEYKLSIIEVLFFTLYIILPSYFALEISESLPLITGSRVLLMLLVLFYIFKNNGKIPLKIFNNNYSKIAFLCYFWLMIITNVYYVPVTNEAVKRICTLIIEELIVVWIIANIIDNDLKLEQVLKVLTISSGIVAIITIINVIIGENLFYKLDTVNRNMLMANYSRLGIVRAEAGFGHAVYYGCYCLCMLPIAMYLIEHSNNKIKYIVCFILNMIGLIISNSRGSLIIAIMLLTYMFLKKKSIVLKKYLLGIVFVILLIIIVLLVSPTIQKYINNVGISIIKTFTVDEIEIEGYGDNKSGILSRTSQFSQVKYSLSRNFLFGLGEKAQSRGTLKWFNPYTNKLENSDTFDVGYFAIACQYGLIGIIAHLFLYSFIIKTVFNRKEKNDNIIQLFKYFFVGYFLMMLSISGVHELFWIFFGLLVAYINIKEKETCN